jgi:RHS repeat-associated protein
MQSITGATTTDSVVSPSGDRLGVRVGATVNWFLPDLHGSIAGSLDAPETTVTNAIRYDAWGQTIGTGTAGGTRVGDTAWKYQGRLDVSPDPLQTPLYDMAARFYSPGTGAFTQLDQVMGSAQDPLSMNRFLYAQANPATLIDPTGHAAVEGSGCVCDDQKMLAAQRLARERTRHHGPRHYRSDRVRGVDHGPRFQPHRVITNRDVRSPAEQILSGLGGVAYDSTVGVVQGIADFATHPDRIQGNLQLAGVALTHLDLTAQVAAEDLGRGVEAFGQLPLEEQVRFVGNIAVAAAGPKVVGAGIGRVSAIRRAAGAAKAGARSFGNFAATDLRVAAQAADRNGLTQVGRALQKHSGRDGSAFNGLSTGTAAARNEQGLRVLDDILEDPNARTEVLDRVMNIWDSTGRGVRYGNDGSFMGFLEPVG